MPESPEAATEGHRAVSTEVMDRQTRSRGQIPTVMKSDPLSGAPAQAGPSPALCPLPAPARRGLPVRHRQPNVPSYHLWRSMWEICRERGRGGQAEEAPLGTPHACDLFQRAQPRWAHLIARQRNAPEPDLSKEGQARRDQGGSAVTLTLGLLL